MSGFAHFLAMAKRFALLIAVASFAAPSLLAQPLDYLWANGMGCPAPAGSADAGYATKVDPSGNVYVTGAFTGTVDFDPGANVANLTATGVGGDIYVAKYDGLGNYLWAFRLGGTAPDEGLAMALAPGGGGVYVTGRWFQPSQDKAFLILVDPGGNLQWTKFISGGSTNCFVHGRAIAIDPAGNILLTGSYTWTVDLDPGPGAMTFTSNGSTNIYLAKYDPSGNFIWGISAGSTGTDIASGLAVDAAGDIYLTGRFTGTVDFDPGPGLVNGTAVGIQDAVVAKYSSAGALLWLNTYGGSGIDDAMAVALDPAGNVVVTGAFFSTMDIDPGAGVVNVTAAGLDDAYLVCFDNSGAFNWGGAMGGIGADTGRGLVVDALEICVTGRFSASADMDPSVGIAGLVSVAASQDVFIAQYTLGGSYIVAQGIGGVGPDVGNGIDLHPSGDVVITGPFWNTADFDPNGGVADLTALASGDSYVARYTRNTALPVELLAFNGRCEGAEVVLEWNTASESNNDRFEVLRSNDGIDWSLIGSVSGAGNSHQLTAYRFTDTRPAEGTAYYRLRQIDLDGSATPSNMIVVNKCTASEVISDLLLDASGRVIGQTEMVSPALPDGMYIRRVERANGVITGRQVAVLANRIIGAADR